MSCIAICAILAAFGFKGRVTTVGVDLGTTFSVVGYSKGGKVTIVQDKHGHRIFPSIVSYLEDGGIVAGYDALPYMATHPKSTIFNAKRFIGRSSDDAEFHAYADAHPFKVVAVDSPHVSNYSKVGFELLVQGATQVVAPEQVGTQMLRYLMDITADFLGHRQVTKAIIAVPAKFTSQQRQATGEAYRRAGLKVIRVLEEPTAAAVAYRLHKRKDIHHILVYDFGGGTLDVSLLFVSKGSVQVYATDGDDTLGGSDLDLCMYGLVKAKVEAQLGGAVKTLAEADLREGGRARDEQCLTSSLRNLAEEVKKKLTYADSVDASCYPPGAADAAPITFTMTRQEFETGCDALFQRSMLPVTRLLEDLGKIFSYILIFSVLCTIISLSILSSFYSMLTRQRCGARRWTKWCWWAGPRECRGSRRSCAHTSVKT